MPPKPIGDRAMTGSERRALHYHRQKAQAEQWRAELERISAARTIRDAEVAKLITERDALLAEMERIATARTIREAREIAAAAVEMETK